MKNEKPPLSSLNRRIKELQAGLQRKGERRKVLIKLEQMHIGRITND